MALRNNQHHSALLWGVSQKKITSNRNVRNTIFSYSTNVAVQLDRRPLSSSLLLRNKRRMDDAFVSSCASSWCSFRFLNTHCHSHRGFRSSSWRLQQQQETTVEKVHGTIPTNGQGVEVGQYAQVERIFSALDVETFGKLVGDKNPLHDPSLEWDAALELMPFLHEHVQAGIMETIANNEISSSSFIPTSSDNSGAGDSSPTEATSNAAPTTKIRAVVHGMLVSSLFSSIFATLAPGCVYINQTLDFVAPVFVDDHVVGRLEITRVRHWPRRRRSGVVVTCDTQILRRRLVPSDDEGGIINGNNNRGGDVPDNDTTAVLAVRGVANVWLPSGSQIPNEEDEDEV